MWNIFKKNKDHKLKELKKLVEFQEKELLFLDKITKEIEEIQKQMKVRKEI